MNRRRTLSRLRDEAGIALISAMLLMSVMMGLGVATLALIDTQEAESGVVRTRETAFNLAEAAMNAQIFQMSNDWPGEGMALNPYPTCTPDSTHPRCPAQGDVDAMFGSADVGDATWSTSVHDNEGGTNEHHYTDSTTGTKPGYDSNGDGKVWIRSQATARGRTRTLIALVRAQEVSEDLPRAAIISGRLEISNKGHKALIDARAGSSESGIVAVRCVPELLETSPCLGHALGDGLFTDAIHTLMSLLDHQITPNIAQTGWGSVPAMDADARARLKARAIADGTYYPAGTCPPVEGLSGAIVYIESATCHYTSNTDFNTADQPGMILMAQGQLWISGTATYHGIIYHANEGGSTGEAFRVHGNATIDGGVLVDGNAMTVAGSSHLNLSLNPNAFTAVRSYGTAGIVQNTWREIVPAN